ncbi:MAG TPA: secondary thiamine-phosphate synthase enzyme YjbQ [Thermoanaerobaculia bacterium]|nr:secondary thiamine-phosphate synthase enzyme YjbQ [Thermoanaerobaculia bacterium]
MKTASIKIPTSAREEIILVTAEVNRALSGLTSEDGICTLFTPHTTVALTINEDADPDVRTDLVAAFRALIPQVRFKHAEGNSDAHLLSAMIGVSISIPFEQGKLLLGRWQGIYLIELDGPRVREVRLYV